MIFQNIEWLMWPPPLLRTAVRMFSGTMAQLFGQQFLDGLAGQVGRRFQRLVQIGHVRLVVLAMVNLHGHFVDVRLQRIRARKAVVAV